MAGRRVFLLLLLIIGIFECVSAKKRCRKCCSYNDKKYKPGQVIERGVDLTCIKKRKRRYARGMSTTGCDYSTFGDMHSMNLPANPYCMNIHKRGVSDVEKRIILNKHNELRANVATGKETRGNPGSQPSAKNMKEMRWNAQLAEVAQAWADQCPDMYNPHEAKYMYRKTCEHETVGQNQYFAWNNDPEPDWELAIDRWYNEVQDMSNLHVPFYAEDDATIGHYTQLVWAETYEVGCGIIYRPDMVDKTEYEQAKVYVCNYGPGGNILGQPIYMQGERKKDAATECEFGRACTYPNLCARPP